MPRNPKDLSASIKLQIDQASKKKVLSDAAEVGKKVSEATSSAASTRGTEKLDKSLKDLVTVAEKLKSTLAGVNTALGGMNVSGLKSVAQGAEQASSAMSKMTAEAKEANAAMKGPGGSAGNSWVTAVADARKIVAGLTTEAAKGKQTLTSLQRTLEGLAAAMQVAANGSAAQKASLPQLQHLYAQVSERVNRLSQSENMLLVSHQKLVAQLQAGASTSLPAVSREFNKLGLEIQRLASDPAMAGVAAQYARLQEQLNAYSKSRWGSWGDLTAIQPLKEAVKLTEELASSEGRVAAAFRAGAGTANARSKELSALTSEVKRLALAQEELRRVDPKAPVLAQADARISQLQKQIASYTPATQEARKASAELTRIQQQLVAGLATYQGTVGSARREVTLYNTALNQLNRVKQQTIQINRTANTTEIDHAIEQVTRARKLAQARVEAEKAAAQSKPGTFKIFGEAFNPVHVAVWAIQWNLVYGAINAVQNGLRDTVANVVEFDKAMRHVNTVARMTEEEFKRISGITRHLSVTPSFGAENPSETARGLYFVESAGIRDTAKALEILTRSAELAIGTQAELGDSVKGVIGLMNIYGEETMGASRAADMLFSVIDAAQPEMKEFAQAQADLLVSAAASKLPFEQLGGAFAALTREGFTASRAATGIKNVIMTLISPSKELKEVILSLGYTSGLDMLKETKSLKQTLLEIYEAAGRDEGVFAGMLKNVRSIGAAMVLVADNGKIYADALKDVDTSFAEGGAAAKAMAEQMKSIGYNAKTFSAALRDAIMSDLSPIKQAITWIGQQMGKAGRSISLGTLTKEIWMAVGQDPKLGRERMGAYTVNDWLAALETGGEGWTPYLTPAQREIKKMIANYVSGRSPALGAQLQLDWYKVLQGEEQGAQRFLKEHGFATEAEAREALGIDIGDRVEKLTPESLGGKYLQAKSEIERKIKVALAGDEEWLKAHAGDVVAAIDAALVEMYLLNAKEDSVGRYRTSPNGPWITVRPVAELRQWKAEWEAKTPGAAKTDTSFENLIERFRRQRDDFYRTRRDIQEILNPPVDNISNAWKEYANRTKAVDVANADLVTSFDSVGSSIQRTAAQYLASAQKLDISKQYLAQFTAELDKAKEKLAADTAENQALNERIQAIVTRIEKTRPADNAPAKVKEAWVKDTKPLLEELDRLRVKQDDVQKRLKSDGDAIKGYTDRTEDLRTSIEALTQDERLLSNLLYNVGSTADEYLLTPFERANKEISDFGVAVRSVMSAFNTQGLVDEANALGRWLEVIQNGKRIAADIAEADRRLELIRLRGSMTPTPSWRDALAGRGGISDIWALWAKEQGGLAAKVAPSFRMASTVDREKAQVEFLADLSRGNVESVDKSIQLIGEVAQYNLPVALEMLAQLQARVEGIAVGGDAARKKVSEFSQELTGDLADAARAVTEADLKMASDANAIYEKLTALRARRAAHIAGRMPELAKADTRDILETANTALAMELGYFQSRTGYMSKSRAATMLVSSLEQMLDELAASPNMQAQAAKALVDLFGSKETAKKFLDDLGDTNPTSRAVADVIIKGLESPDIPDTIGKMARNLRGIMEQEFTEGFMSIVEQGKSFEQAMNDIFRQIAIDLERQLISKMVSTGIGWLFGDFSIAPSGGGGTGYYSSMDAGIGLPRMATGGITSGPTIAGEGRMREAVVPLPNGRHIPVQLMGSASKPQEIKSTTVVVFDRQQLAAMRTGKDEIVNVVYADLTHNGPIRQAIKRSLR